MTEKNTVTVDGIEYINAKYVVETKFYGELADKVLKRATELWNKEPTVEHSSRPELKDGHLLLPLPNCNTDWSFFVFDLAKKLYKEFGNDSGTNVYPVHGGGSDHNDGDYLYIYISE